MNNQLKIADFNPLAASSAIVTVPVKLQIEKMEVILERTEDFEASKDNEVVDGGFNPPPIG